MRYAYPPIRNSEPAKPGMTLQQRLSQIDQLQANRFRRLTGESLMIATEGILRHLRACDRMDVAAEPSAIREIIEDSLENRRVYAETSSDAVQLEASLNGKGKKKK